MASTYLTLVNRVLTRLNEVNLTSSTFATALGVHGAVKDAINDSIRMILAEEQEWPFTISNLSQTLTSGVAEYAHNKDLVDWNSFAVSMPDLITNGDFTTDITGWTNISGAGGTAAYTATGNGRARLTGNGVNAGAITQSITTVANQVYRIRTKVYGGTITMNIGTTSGGSEISTNSLVVDDLNRGDIKDTTFTALGIATFISFSNTSTTAKDVDRVTIQENILGQKLLYRSFEQFLENYKDSQLQEISESYTLPDIVYQTDDLKFGVYPTPDKEYIVTAYAYVYPNDLSLFGDTTVIPSKFDHVIVEGAMQMMYLFREDFEQAAFVRDRYKKYLRHMRAQLIDYPNDMRGAYYFSRLPSATSNAAGWYTGSRG